MEEIARLFYRAYTRNNVKKHYQTSEELTQLEKSFLSGLDDEQHRVYNELVMLYMEHCEERELRLLTFILQTMTDEA